MGNLFWGAFQNISYNSCVNTDNLSLLMFSLKVGFIVFDVDPFRTLNGAYYYSFQNSVAHGNKSIQGFKQYLRYAQIMEISSGFLFGVRRSWK